MSQPKLLGIHPPSKLQPGCTKKKKKNRCHATIKKLYKKNKNKNVTQATSVSATASKGNRHTAMQLHNYRWKDSEIKIRPISIENAIIFTSIGTFIFLNAWLMILVEAVNNFRTTRKPLEKFR